MRHRTLTATACSLGNPRIASRMRSVAKASTAVLNLTAAFDTLDRNSSGGIDAAELRRGLQHLGMDSHSPQAEAILSKYTEAAWIDIKAFTTLVRDVHLLLTFDQDGSGSEQPDDEPAPSLASFGGNIGGLHARARIAFFAAAQRSTPRSSSPRSRPSASVARTSIARRSCARGIPIARASWTCSNSPSWSSRFRRLPNSTRTDRATLTSLSYGLRCAGWGCPPRRSRRMLFCSGTMLTSPVG